MNSRNYSSQLFLLNISEHIFKIDNSNESAPYRLGKDRNVSEHRPPLLESMLPESPIMVRP